MLARRAIAAAIMSVAAALVAGCGIPRYAFLAAPEAGTVVVVLSTVSFVHNAEGNAGNNFLGYEVYYKFYSYDADPSEGPFAQDRAAVAAAGTGPSLLPSGFHRITEADDNERGAPLVPVDSSAAITITLTFPDRIEATYTIIAAWETEVLPIVRDPVSGGGLSSKTFEPADIVLDPPDPDIPAGTEASGGLIHMGIVVMAYGINYDDNSFSPIYSQPVMAGDPVLVIIE